LAALNAEHMINAPGLAETMEPDGTHSTETVDYVVVTEGELSMQTDDGAITTLRPGDVLVQNGTRHAWRNLTDKPAAMIVVLIGGAS
jgi:quercetin dioxygenase-like cupin family protein